MEEDIFDQNIIEFDLIDFDKLSADARVRAERIGRTLSGSCISPELLEANPFIKERIKSTIDDLQQLLRLLSIDENIHDKLVQQINVDCRNASLFSALTKLQTTMITIQIQLDTKISNLQNSLKNVQLELNFNNPDEQISNHCRGTKDYIKNIREKNDNL